MTEDEQFIEQEAVNYIDAVRAAGLSIDDPEIIPDLLYPIPPGAALKSLAQDYDTQRSTGRKVRCSACAHHQHHYRGFVAELENGQRALIGINCGEKHFGEGEWERMSAGLTRAQHQAYFEARIAPALAGIEQAYLALAAWRGGGTAFAAFRSVLATLLPSFDDMIVEACVKNEGHLHRYVRAASAGAGLHAGPGQAIEAVRYGKVPSPAAFVRGFPKRLIGKALEDLRSAKRLLTERGDIRSIRRAFVILREGQKRLEDAHIQFGGMRRNAEIGWWDEACRMYRDDARERLTLRGRTLVIDPGLGEPKWLQIPAVTGNEIAQADAALASWPR